MELIRWTPKRDLFRLNDSFNRIFEDFFSPTVRNQADLSSGIWNPAVDIFDNEDNIVIKVELPGVEKKDIEVDVKGRHLTLKGERKTESEQKDKQYYCRERFFGKYERTFTLPAEVDTSKVKAEYKDGVLSLEVPKPEKQKARHIAVH